MSGLMEALAPAPRIKSSVWKFTFWVVVMTIVAQLVWLSSIPFLRQAVTIEVSDSRHQTIPRAAAKDRKSGKRTESLPTALVPGDRPDKGTSADAAAARESHENQTGEAMSKATPEKKEKKKKEPKESRDETIPATAARPGLGGISPPLTAAPAADPSERIADLLQESEEFRAMGDPMLSIAKLREALDIQPTHVEALVRLGNVFEQSGLERDAESIWRQLFQLGPSVGPAWEMAKVRLERLEQNLEQGYQRDLAERRNGLPGKLRFEKLEDQSAPGKNRTFRVAIKSTVPGPIQPGEVKLGIYFFEADSQNIYPIKDTLAVWVNKPNWASGSEELLAQWVEGRNAGASYFGYIVRIHYEGELQDEFAEPARLLKLQSR